MKGFMQTTRGIYAWRGFLVVLLGFIYAFCIPLVSNAAKISIDAPDEIYGVGDTFVLPIRIDPEGQCINAIEVTLAYDADILTAVDVGRGNSILSLWTEDPQIDKERGVVSFSGGIPGGYCGRVSGDPGQTNVLANLVVSANGAIPAQGATTTISIVRSSVLQNDGRGTPLPTTVTNTMFRVEKENDERSNEWLDEVKADVIAPELFDVVLSSNPSVAGGKKFVAFSAVDKQSGVDHYEILETDPNRFGLLSWISKEAHWVVGKSPYILRDQSLRSSILVKAVDKAGNERVVTYRAPEELIEKSPLDYIGLIILVVVALGVLFGLFRYSSGRRQKSKRTNVDDTQHTYDADGE